MGYVTQWRMQIARQRLAESRLPIIDIAEEAGYQSEAAFGRVRSEAIRLVKLRLEAAGISLPSPEFLVRMTDDGPNRVLGSGDDAPTSGAAPSFEATDVRREQEDVSRDDSVDRQIEAERLESDEEDLLETPASSQSDSA